MLWLRRRFFPAVAGCGLCVALAGCQTSSRLALHDSSRLPAKRDAIQAADAEAALQPVRLETAPSKELELQPVSGGNGSPGTSLLGGLFKHFREPERIPLPRTDVNAAGELVKPAPSEGELGF